MSKIKEILQEFKVFGLNIAQILMILLFIFVILVFTGIIKIGFAALAGVALVGLLIYGYIDLVIIKGKSLDDLLQNDSKSVIRFISAASTVGETVGLIIIATEVRGVSFASATIRFGLIGVLEVLFTFLFISVFHESLYTEIGKALWGDKHINFLEKIWIFIVVTFKTTPFFLLALSITNFIWILYLESIYNVELYITGVKFWEFAIDPINIEGMTQAPELSAWFMVFATPILNVMLVVFELKSINQKLDNDEIKQVKPLSVILSEKKAAKAAAASKPASGPGPTPNPGSTPPTSGTPPPPSTPPPSKSPIQEGSVTDLIVTIWRFFNTKSHENDFVLQDPLDPDVSKQYGIFSKSFVESDLYKAIIKADPTKDLKTITSSFNEIEETLHEFITAFYETYGIKIDGDVLDANASLKVELVKGSLTSDTYFNKLSSVAADKLTEELHNLVFSTFSIGPKQPSHIEIKKVLSKLDQDVIDYKKLDDEFKTASSDPVSNANIIRDLNKKKIELVQSATKQLNDVGVKCDLVSSTL